MGYKEDGWLEHGSRFRRSGRSQPATAGQWRRHSGSASEDAVSKMCKNFEHETALRTGHTGVGDTRPGGVLGLAELLATFDEGKMTAS